MMLRTRPVRILAAAALAVAVWGCDENPSQTQLPAPGGRGNIAGTLVFPAAAPDTAAAQVLAFQNENPDCESAFGAIAVMGTFNDFDLQRVNEFLMVRVAPCLWAITLELDAGLQEFKLVTGDTPEGVAYDSPGDYGVTAGNDGSDPLDGTLDNPANGPDGNISITLPSSGEWTVVLNEATSPASYRITKESLFVEVVKSAPDFEIKLLPVGEYDLSVTSSGYIARFFRGIEVRHLETVDLGQIPLEQAAGMIRGTVAFADEPAVAPTVAIDVTDTASGLVVQSLETQGAFTVEGLPSGTYDFSFRARCYLDAARDGVVWVNGSDTDLGTIEMDPGPSEFSTVQIVGDFTGGFDNLSGAPFMVQDADCVWRDTLSVPAGAEYFFKFVTDGTEGNDYGGDESVIRTLPGTFPVLAGVSQGGGAIRISVPVAGNYVFSLDEHTPAFSAALLGEVPQGSIEGTVAFDGIAAPPFPEAQVDLLPAGGGSVIAGVTSDAQTGDFRFEVVEDGTYDLRLTAPCFETTMKAGVTVASAPEDVGTIEMAGGASGFSTVQIAGQFTGNFDLGQAPFMTQGPGCVWKDTLQVDAGDYLFKFVTDGAFDTPEDFGGDEGTTLTAPDTFPVEPVSGQGTAISISFPVTTEYEFVLDERNLTFTVNILGEVPEGSIQGIVAFTGLTDPPFPAARVRLFASGETTAITSVSSNVNTGAFRFPVVDAGTYDIEASATCRETKRITDITVVGTEVDAGTVTLEPGASPYSTIQIAGDFNGFDLGRAPFMTQDEQCVWADTLNLGAGSYNLKFVTDGAFDTPPDYGGDETPIPVPAEDEPAAVVSGIGTAITIQVTIPGDYRFELDENRRVFSILLVGDVPEGSVVGAVGFEGIADPPFPPALVAVFESGTSNLAGSTISDTLGTFTFGPVQDGTYDLEVTASCFGTETRTGVTVAGGETDAGLISLAEGESTFDTIQIAGDFNGFNLESAPQMSAGESCTWTATVMLSAGTYNMKFVTNGNFDDPPDYGGDQTSTLTLPGTFDVMPVTGEGTALSIEVPADGEYVFTLDERNRRFTVEAM